MTPPLLCPHRPPCPGCPRFGQEGISAAAQGSLGRLASDHDVPAPTVISGAVSGFRHRARLAIRGRLGTPKLGLFELASHRVVHIPNCMVHHPLINRVAAVVRRALVEANVTCYSDKAHLGLARYLQVVVERRSQTAQVVLVGNSAAPEHMAACSDLIRERLGPQLHSLWFNSQCERTNVILGPEFHRWWGAESVIEEFGGSDVHYPPGAFGQSNLEIAQCIIDAVRSEIPDGARVTEFYAGVGAVGLSVLKRAARLHMNELGTQSLRGLEMGLAALDSADRAKVTVIAGNALDARLAADAADVVIVDPPRKGLGPELCDYLTQHPPARVLYISCGIDSFLDDTARLTSGKLKLTALTAFNLLPFTEHVETLARFERV